MDLAGRLSTSLALLLLRCRALPCFTAPSPPISATTASAASAKVSHLPGGKLRPTRSREPRITAREDDVLGLLIEGRTTQQMAHALGLKPTTIRTYLQRLYRKTHTKTRPALVWWWAQRREDTENEGR